ncbi:MAG TPA: hypothetical protein VIM28_00470, partial [Solirubrobacterales bacterium]
MKVPATIRWVALALLGLLIAAGVSIAASSLVSQQIGLASEPISAGDALAPKASSRANRHQSPRRKASPAKTPTEPAPAETTAPPPASTEPQSPAAPPSTVPVVPAPPSGSSPSGGEQDHGGGG